jgi:hypothetical protein
MALSDEQAAGPAGRYGKVVAKMRMVSASGRHLLLCGAFFGATLFCAWSVLQNTYAAPNASIGSCSGAVTISSSADWNKLDGSGTVFCVRPGNYSGTLTVSSDGTSAEPRILRFEASSRTYKPWQASSKATFSGKITFGAANHWVIDGIRFTRGDVGNNIRIRNSSNITLQNVLVEGGGSGTGQLNLRPGNSNITINNSVFRDTMQGGGDRHCIKLVGLSTNIQFLDNEIYNCAGDGIQIGNGNSSGDIDMNEGVLIQGNDFYIPNSLYSDCNGNKTVDGACACAENAIDVKGTTRAEDPVPESKWLKILGNRIWGFQKPDSACGGSPNSHTQSVVFHWGGSDNILFKDNIVFDAGGGLGMPQKAVCCGVMDHISVINNIFYNIYAKTTSGGGGVALFGKEAVTTEYYFNTIIQPGQFYIQTSAKSGNNEFRCNLVIDGKTDSGSDNTTASHNAYYNTKTPAEDKSTSSMMDTNAAPANMRSYCFSRRRLTEPQETYCIPNAEITTSSPHANLCEGVSVGTVKGIGVNDALWNAPQAGAKF